MKVGLDTTVVLRLLTGEPADEAAVAARRLERAVAAGHAVLVTDLVVAEAYHALHYHYGVPKDAARKQLVAMLGSGAVQLDPPDVAHALDAARGAGLVDRLIAARHRRAAATTWTFDRKLGAVEGVERLSRSPR